MSPSSPAVSSDDLPRVAYVEFSTDIEFQPGVYISKFVAGQRISRVGGPPIPCPDMRLAGDDILFVDTGDRFPLPGTIRRYRLFD